MTLRKNYCKTCLYCGVAFKSNRTTAEYCCPQHGSLFRAQRLKDRLERDNKIMAQNNEVDMAENNLKAQLNVTLDLMEQESWLQAQRLSKLKEEYNTVLLKAYNDHLNLSTDLWSRPLTEGMIRYMYRYLGPLPEESGSSIIVGNFLIKPAMTKLYKIKPLKLGSEEELESIRRAWVKHR